MKLTPLMSAALFGHLEIVKFLVGRGVSLEDRGTSFYSAPPCVIINMGLDDDGDTAIQDATVNGHWDIVRYLADRGASVNPAGDSFALLLGSHTLTFLKCQRSRPFS